MVLILYKIILDDRKRLPPNTDVQNFCLYDRSVLSDLIYI